MNRVIARLKNIRLDRILTIFIATMLLFVSTACSGSKVLAKTADQIRPEVPDSAVTSPYTGGMNDYPDVDPRTDTSAADAKAKALRDTVQKNIDEKSVDSPEQYVENYRGGAPLGERVRKIGENIGDTAKDVGETAAKGVRQNAQGAQDAASSARESAEDTANAAQSKVKSDVNSTKQTLSDTADAAKSKVSKDVSRTKQALDDAADAVD